MKLNKRIITTLSVIIIGMEGLYHEVTAETRVSGTELKTLLSGNTVEGKYIKWKTTHKMYFEATGKLRRIDSLNNKEKGEWYIDDSGNLCISVKKYGQRSHET